MNGICLQRVGSVAKGPNDDGELVDAVLSNGQSLRDKGCICGNTTLVNACSVG